MQTKVYANQQVSAQTEQANSNQSPDNFLHLLPEHRNEINNQWLSHMASQRISGNGLRVLSSIYRYTIGFNKISDDMSGRRLQQISCIRADHANHTLKLLAADNTIVSTKGRYGRVLSINFDFASWGNSQKNKSAIKLIRDPRHLLPKYYHEDPIDTGNQMSASGETPNPEISEHPHEHPTINNPAPVVLNETPLEQYTHPTHPTEDETHASLKADEHALNVEQVLQTTTQLFEQLVKKFDHLEQHVQELKTQNSSQNTAQNTVVDHTPNDQIEPLVQDLQPQQRPHNTVDNSVVDHTVVDHIPSDYNAADPIPHEAPLETPKANVNPAVFVPMEQAESVSPPEFVPMEQAEAVYTVENNNNAANQDDNEPEQAETESRRFDQSPKIAPLECVDVNALRYPETLNPATCRALAGLLCKAGDHAQNILDLLEVRMENTSDPINDIVLYCASLVRNSQNNTLDLDSLRAHRTRQKITDNPQEKQRQALQQEYHEAITEYNHFKHINERQARAYECTEEEYLEQSGLMANWIAILQRLEKVQQAMEQQ